MRTTTVPAQITTVEDKVAGEFNMKQLILLVTPVFGSAALYVGLPPFFASVPYKVAVMVCLFVVCATLAVRIKGAIILDWLRVLVGYMMRPRYYLFNKNDPYLRDAALSMVPLTTVAPLVDKEREPPSFRPLTTTELMTIEQLMQKPEANLHFRATKKGAISVHITEI